MYADEQLVGRYTGSELARGVNLLTTHYESPLTERVLQFAMEKYHYHWTNWRAPDTGLAEMAPGDYQPEDWQALNDALARMAHRADLREFQAIAAAKSVKWRCSEEFAVPLPDWETLPPYNYLTFDTAYPPEVNAEALLWAPIHADINGFVDLMPAYGTFRNSVVSARTKLFVPSAARLSLSIGTDGPVKVWVNGQVCLAHDIQRTAEAAQDTGTALLHPGWNSILLRETRGVNGWGFFTQAYLTGLSQEERLEVKTGAE